MTKKTVYSVSVLLLGLLAGAGAHAGNISVDARAMQSMLAFLGAQPLGGGPATTLSPGCALPTPRTAPGALLVDGQLRQFILVAPRGYRPHRPHRLVFGFHGRTNSNAKARRYFDLEEHAPPDTLFVYPGGISNGKGAYSWFNPRDRGDALRDYRFFDTLLAYIDERYCVNRQQVYLVAHSLGASFANSLACARADKVRAVATLAGGVMPSRCQGPVAAMVLHNPKDRLVPLFHGIRARDHFLSQNGIDDTPAQAGPKRFNCRRYGNARNPVLWCPHNHDYSSRGRFYPHNWPRLTGKTIMDFFASLP